MFRVSASEPCQLESAKWYDKGFIRVSFRAGSEVLACFFWAENQRVPEWNSVLHKITQNISRVFDITWESQEQPSKVDYLKWLATELDEKKGSECRVKIGLKKEGEKFILTPQHIFTPFIERDEGHPRLKYSEYENKHFGQPKGLEWVGDEPVFDEQEILFEDFQNID